MPKCPPLLAQYGLSPDREVWRQDGSRGGAGRGRSARHLQPRQGAPVWAAVRATRSVPPRRDAGGADKATPPLKVKQKSNRQAELMAAATLSHGHRAPE